MRALGAARLHAAGAPARAEGGAGVAARTRGVEVRPRDTPRRAAVEAGRELRTETVAGVVPEVEVPADEPWRKVLLERPGEAAVTALARSVIVADGLGHRSLRDCPSFESRGPSSSRVGVGGEAGPGIVGVEPESITMAVARHGYVGAVEVEGGQVNIAAAIAPSFLKNAGGPAAAVQAILLDAGVPVNGPLEAVDWLGTPPLTRRLVRPAERGIFVLGDAAGYVEPFTGEGMAWAFAGAEAVVPFVKRAAASPNLRLEDEWTRALARTIGHDQRRCRVLAWSLRQPALVAMFLSLLRRNPGLAAPVLARFSPRTHPLPERTA